MFLSVSAPLGVAPPGPGVMVMQLSVPNGPQPSQNPPLVQWNPCKYYSIEQRASKPGELYKPDNTPQVHEISLITGEAITKHFVHYILMHAQ